MLILFCSYSSQLGTFLPFWNHFGCFVRFHCESRSHFRLEEYLFLRRLLFGRAKLLSEVKNRTIRLFFSSSFSILGNIGGLILFFFFLLEHGLWMWAKWIAEFKKKERIQKENKLIFRLSVIITSVSVYSDLFLVGEKNKDWNIFFFENCKMCGILWIKWNKSFIQVWVFFSFDVT